MKITDPIYPTGTEIYGRRRETLRPKKPSADKGKKGGSCNRTACQKPGSATWWNSGTDTWYCPDCARAINAACNDVGQICFPERVDREQALRAMHFSDAAPKLAETPTRGARLETTV